MTLLALVAALSAALAFGVAAVLQGIATARTPVSAAVEPVVRYPFTLGVASGDPEPDSVVLWTRLAPAPLTPDGSGGMPASYYQVSWELSTS